MKLSRALSLSLVLAAPLAFAQSPAPDAAPPSARQPHGKPHGPGFDGKDPGMPFFGTWWKDDATIKAIGLTPDQQKKIDDIFVQARVQLVQLHTSLEEQEKLLGPIMASNPIDQGKAMGQIEKIANTRADLEKANARMFLSIRSVLSADQWTKLRAYHHAHHGPDGPGGMRGRRGPDGPPPAAAPEAK